MNEMKINGSGGGGDGGGNNNLAAVDDCCAKENQLAVGKGSSGNDAANGAVFKSANWLSDNELIFSLSNQVGGLVRALRVFQELDIGVKHVESRKSKRRDSEFEIFVDIDCSDKEKMRKLVHHLR